MKNKKLYELSDDIVNYATTLYKSTPADDPQIFDITFAAHSYSAFSISQLQKCSITPEIAMLIARMYLAAKDNYVASVIMLNRQNKLKCIDDFARDYRPLFSGFAETVKFLCKCKKCKKCIIVYNYNTNGSLYDEIYDLDRLHGILAESGINLIDAVKVVNGKATSIIAPFIQ